MASPAPRRSSRRLRGETPQYEAKQQESCQTLESVVEQEPSIQVSNTMPGEFPSAEFEFSHSMSLSAEAQQMMADIRRKAAKVLDAVREEKAAEEKQGVLVDSANPGQITLPAKGRFSDVHDAQFSKMSSIANHPSAFRISTSKAPPHPPKNTQKEMDKPQSPAKRRRVTESNHVAVGTMSVPKASVTTPTKSSLARTSSSRSITKFPSTPSTTSLTKMLSKTPNSGIKTEGNHKFRNALAQVRKISTPVKSILRRPQPRFSDDPAKVAAGTHLPPPKFNLSQHGIDQQRSPKRVGFSGVPDQVFGMSVSSTAITPDANMAKGSGVKYPDLSNTTVTTGSNRVTYPSLGPSIGQPGNFTFRADQNICFASAIPSVNKSPKVYTPTIRKVTSRTSDEISTPAPPLDLRTPNRDPEPAYIAHGLTNKKRKHSDEYDTGGLDIVVKQAVDQSPSRGSVALNRISTPTKTPPSKPRASARQIKTPVSVRVARTLGVKTTSSAAKLENKRSPAAYIQHGLSNKKRKHSDTYDTAGLDIVVPNMDEDKENTPSRLEKSSPAKRARLVGPSPMALKRTPISASKTSILRTPLSKSQVQSPSKSTGARKKPGLSLARLNALAAPKRR